MTIYTALSIGAGGFIGAILRALTIGFVNKVFPHDLPFGTGIVNIIGSFIMGGLFAFFSFYDSIDPHLKSFLSTGILGAFTTFSTFAFETTLLFSSGLLLISGNILLNVVGSILFAFLGHLLVMRVMG